MKLDYHVFVAAAGLICLAALACLLWEPETETTTVREVALGPVPVSPEPAPTRARVTTYDRGRTTIKPLVTRRYLDAKRAA